MYDLSEYLDLQHIKGSFEFVSILLRSAAKVTRVNLDPDPFGETMFCRSSWEYEKSKAAADEKFIAELVRFNFIFQAFEALTESLVYTSKKMGYQRAAVYLENGSEYIR